MARTGNTKNFYIWDELKHTDPEHTKPFPKFGKNLTTDVSNFNKITGVKIPAIITDCHQIAYSVGVTIS